MTELIMNTLDIIDRDLADKIANVLNLNGDDREDVHP